MKSILFSIFAFFLFYLEYLQIGPIRFTIVWKIPLIMFLVLNVINIKMPNKIILLGYLFAFKHLLTLNIFENFIPQFTLFSKFLIIPLCFHFYYSKVKVFRKDYLDAILIKIALFIIIGNLPFLLNIIQPLYTNVSMGAFEESVFSFVGLFGSPHANSIYLALAVVIIFSKITITKGYMRFFYIGIMLIGLLMLYKTYVRTGWLMFIIGMIVFYNNRLNRKVIRNIIITSLFTISAVVFLFKTSESFRSRVLDDRIGQEDIVLEDKLGSGRLNIWSLYIDTWKESDLVGQFIGVSDHTAVSIYAKKTGGKGLFAHNGLIMALVGNGIIGLLLVLLFLKFIYIQLENQVFTRDRRLGLAIYSMLIVCALFQELTYFLFNIIIALLLIISVNNKRIFKIQKKMNA